MIRYSPLTHSPAAAMALAFALASAATAPAQTPAAATPSASVKSDAGVASDAISAKPLAVGAKAPEAVLADADGKPVKMSALLAEGPALVIFTRGGWCPYCTTQLGKLATIEGDLKAAGYRIVALTHDAPEFLKADAAKAKIGYMLLSDAAGEAARAFGVAFRVDDGTRSKYLEKYKLDLDKRAGGRTDHVLPMPAAFVIDKAGVIRYAYSNPDYAVRVDAAELLNAARAAR